MAETWWQKPFFWVSFALAIVLVFFILKIHTENLFLSPNSNNNLTTESTTKEIVNSKSPAEITISPQDPVLGSAAAKMTIIELADFECPYCSETSPVVLKFTKDNSAQVKLVWKDFIIPSHPNSLAAAQAAQCAGRQGKFWEYQQYLFTNQDVLSSNFYLSLAQNLSLDMAKFTTCLINSETLPLIQFNQQEIAAVGLRETPAYIINGQLYRGEVTVEALESFLQTL